MVKKKKVKIALNNNPINELTSNVGKIFNCSRRKHVFQS